MTDPPYPSTDPTAQTPDPDSPEQRTGGTKAVDPEPETERGGSPATHSSSRTNEEESDVGNS